MNASLVRSVAEAFPEAVRLNALNKFTSAFNIVLKREKGTRAALQRCQNADVERRKWLQIQIQKAEIESSFGRLGEAIMTFSARELLKSLFFRQQIAYGICFQNQVYIPEFALLKESIGRDAVFDLEVTNESKLVLIH